MNQSFEDGRSYKPFSSGGDWHEYNRGRNEREWYDKQTNAQIEKKSGGTKIDTENIGNGGVALGKFILWVILAVVWVAALLGGVIIFLLSKLGILESKSLGSLIRTAFYATIVYISIIFLTGCILIVFPELIGHVELSALDFKLGASYWTRLQANFSIMALPHLSALFFSTLVIRKRAKEDYIGIAGYLKAVFVTAVSIVPALMLTGYFLFLIGINR